MEDLKIKLQNLKEAKKKSKILEEAIALCEALESQIGYKDKKIDDLQSLVKSLQDEIKVQQNQIQEYKEELDKLYDEMA